MQVRGPGVGRDPEGSTMPTLQLAGRWDSTDGVPLCKDAECAEHLEPTQRKPQPELSVQVPMTGQVDFTEGTGAPAGGSGNHQAKDMEEKRQGVAARGG